MNDKKKDLIHICKKEICLICRCNEVSVSNKTSMNILKNHLRNRSRNEIVDRKIYLINIKYEVNGFV